MRHLKSGRKLNRHSSHRLALYRNQAKSLLTHGRITTTVPKAKELRGFVDHLIHLAKRGDLHARRLVLRDLQDVKLVRKLFDEIAPRYRDRQGGTPGSSSWRSAGGGTGRRSPWWSWWSSPAGTGPPGASARGALGYPVPAGHGGFPQGSARGRPDKVRALSLRGPACARPGGAGSGPRAPRCRRRGCSRASPGFPPPPPSGP